MEAVSANKEPPSLLRVTSSRILMAAGIALLLQVAICFAEFSDEMYYAKHYVNLESDRLASAVQPGGAGLKLTPGASLAHFFGVHSQSYAFRILDADGKPLAVHNYDLFRKALIIDYDKRARPREWLHKFDADRWLHVAGSVPREVAGKVLTIEVGTRGDPARQRYYAVLNDLWDDVWTPVVPTIVLMTLFALCTVRGALNSLVKLAHDADGIKAGGASARFELAGLPREGASFAAAINRLLDRNAALAAFKERMAQSTAHELRTPLHVMLLEVANIPGDSARKLEQDIGQMSAAIDRLLALALLESLAELGDEVVCLVKLSEAEVVRFKPLLSGKGSSIVLKLEDPLTFRGDPTSVSMAIRNLIENAWKHTPEGALVEVTCGPGARLVVEDGGKGLSDIDHARLFEPFHRGLTPSDGSGLGLAIVKEVVARHSGSIQVDRSALGGARFVLEFASAHSQSSLCAPAQS